MNLTDELPWLSEPWRQLCDYVETGRIPQALLIVGLNGIGKRRLAEVFAQRLLCQKPAGAFPCGDCPSCQLFTAQTHPDYLPIEPTEPGKAIKVDEIRGLIDTLSLKPQYGTHRVVILSPAQQMNLAAANSLLKTLEEPDERTVILLLSESPASLPATILSRCQRLNISIPSRQQTLDWLHTHHLGEQAEILWALSQGAPLKALNLAKEQMIEQRSSFFVAWRDVYNQKAEPLEVADQWQKFSCELLNDWMISWTIDLIRLHQAPTCMSLNNYDLKEALQAMTGRLNLKNLFHYLELLNATKIALGGQVNRLLALEALMIQWSQTPINSG